MKVAKWGNSLAVRLPGEVVKILGLSEGGEIELHVEDGRTFGVAKKPGSEELLKRVGALRGRVPSDFRFDRLGANER